MKDKLKNKESDISINPKYKEEVEGVKSLKVELVKLNS